MDATQELLDTIGKANFTCGRYLLTEAKVAHTFLDLAEQSDDREVIERNLQRGREALAAIDRFRDRFALDPEQREQIRIAREQLKMRLAKIEPEPLRSSRAQRL